MNSYSDSNSVDFAHVYHQEFKYSTLHGGGNDSPSDLERNRQYNHLLPYLAEEPSLESQSSFGQLLPDTPVEWHGGFELLRPLPQADLGLADNLDTGDLQHFTRPADEEPWSTATFRGGFVLPLARTFPRTGHGSKAHSISCVVLTPQSTQPSRLPADSSLTTPDSGFESAQPAQVREPKRACPPSHPTATEGSLFGSEAAPTQLDSARSESHLQLSGGPSKRRRTKGSVFPCPSCPKVNKNQSDAYKHELQHTKPFRCTFPGCVRQEGFATPNDLQRHRKSVHKQRPEVGKESGYICQACPAPPLGAAPKWWPRLDNFKAHIGRKHTDWDAAYLVQISEALRPEDATTESGYVSHAAPSMVTEEHIYPPRVTSPTMVPLSRQTCGAEDPDLFDLQHPVHDSLACVGEGQEMQAVQIRKTSGSEGVGLSMLSDVALQVSQCTQSVSHTSTPSLARLSEAGVSSHYDTESLHRTGQVQWSEAAAAKWLGPGWAPKDRNGTNSQGEPKIVRTSSGGFQCPYASCPKVKSRLCDLRKHYKRHTRPYGCTFPNCYKRFGSRNDWKRHENSQHHLNDMWRCDRKLADGTICGKIFPQEALFESHLSKKHDMEPGAPATRKYIKDMHLGREAHDHFWCGFCVKLWKQKDDAPNDVVKRSAWVMRHKHIGDHFDKQHMHIDQWVCIEHNKLKGLMTKEEKRRARGRFKSETMHDDSDLPDDGIPAVLNLRPHTLSATPTHDRTSSSRSSGKRKSDDAELDADGVSDDEDWCL